MTAVQRFRNALQELQVETSIRAEIFRGYENINDSSQKAKRAEFFRAAIPRMESLLPVETCRAVRDACACSKSGWRLKASQKIAREYAGRSMEEKVEALNQVMHMGKPRINEYGTITAQIGEVGGFACPCPVFEGSASGEPVSKTYCFCCAGHFRFHYQIALGLHLETVDVLSSALESRREEPCRFIYKIISQP